MARGTMNTTITPAFTVQNSRNNDINYDAKRFIVEGEM